MTHRAVRSEDGHEDWLVSIVRIRMEWLCLLGSIKRQRLFLLLQSVSKLPVIHIPLCFNAYSVTKVSFSTTTFMERISGFGRDFCFDFPNSNSKYTSGLKKNLLSS